MKELYESFESDRFKSDYDRCIAEIGRLGKWVEDTFDSHDNAAGKMKEYIQRFNEFFGLYTRLRYFADLTISVDAKNEKANKIVDILEEKLSDLTKPQVIFQKWLSGVGDLEKLIAADEYLKEYGYFLNENKEKSKYLLSDSEELIISKMMNTGSGAWSKLQGLLTSMHLVDINVKGEQKQLPLPVVINMYYSDDPETRKAAYEAEISSYKKIEESVAASLNSIKGEVITVCRLKGYKSPLEKTVLDSRMDMETLDAMLAAIRESLPHFHKYYRKKAELLGYKGGLPFYEIFAPMGNADIKFTYEEAKDYVVSNFRSFSDKLADFAKNAFENGWIDAEPREGKRGGAFCSNIHAIGQSRILANFNGTFNNMTTLAHELGHGYHGDNLMKEGFLNSDYPMPIAETASIMCETIVKEAALKAATPEAAFSILEADIADSGQVIVDIYSRFLFESSVFEHRENGSLSVDEIKELMLKAQREAFGDGLDHDLLHPYMWLWKPHYYSGELSFYNFPYAFGLLFAKGLYAEYLKRGKAFVEDYDRLLAATGKMKIADVAKIMNIDVHKVDFWRSSLELITKDIEKFISLK